MKDLHSLGEMLQNDLGLFDSLSRRSGRSDSLELLIIKLENLKLKIYQEPGHALPHIHIDYGKTSHAASYSIDPPTRLVGLLNRKYDKTITTWMELNKENLLALWKTLQAGGDSDALITVLQEKT